VWAALDDGAICVWNAKDQTFVKKLIGHTKSLRCLAEVQSGANSASFLGRKSSLVVSSGDDTKLCLWNARSVPSLSGRARV
jgi:WD40 repeat protein